jgi:hypothetical protein
MKEDKYISVAKFAKLANVTVQAVYKRINSDLKSYCIEINNKKMIDVDALNLFKPNLNSTNNQNEIALLEKTISLLENELKLKNKQIEDLNYRLQESLLLINQQQKLHAISEKKQNELEIEKIEKKKKWWKFW